MKDIRIFVASSKELEKERNYLAFLVLAKEDEFAARGLRVRLAKWEYVDPKMTEARTEDRYLDEMYNCDAALVLFRDIAGMYTREELDKALAAERTGLAPDSRKARLKTHRILFAKDCRPDSDAAKLRESLPPDSYGEWTDLAGLGEAFLALVDAVSRLDGLADVPDEDVRVVSAFVAADDELAADRNAFADTVLNLNEILMRRGVRVKMRFYDPKCHRELLESSEMALVLYDTTCRAFGPDQMKDAYDRTRREENPRRLYVFFRDEDEAKLDGEFVAFRNGFAENLGHFFCRFENVDTLKLNFLLSLENALGEGAAFVKLDGKVVKADELEVGEITKLPMVANNGGLNDLLAAAAQVTSEFERQREKCRETPDDASAYVELLKLSTRKNDLESQVNKELSRSFDLAKRMAAVSAKEANDTIARARSLLDEGRMEEAVQLLDGASSEIDDVLGDIGGLEDLMEQKLKTLEAWIDVELFRADTVLAFAREPFPSRFAKAEGIYKALLAKTEKVLTKNRPKNLAKILRSFAKLYGEVGDTLSPLPLLEKALKLYQSVEILEPESCGVEMAEVHMALAYKEQLNNQLVSAKDHYARALDFFRGQGDKSLPQLSACQNGLAILHADINYLTDAEREFAESLEIRRRLAKDNPAKFEEDVAESLNNLAILHMCMNHLADAEHEYIEALEIRRRLAKGNPAKFEEDVAMSLNSLANLHRLMNRLADAEREHYEALEIRRRLAKGNPAKFKEYVAGSLNNLSNLHQNMNCFADAESESLESLEIYHHLAKDNPAKFEEYVATSLNNLAILHRRMNHLADAEREYSEVLEIRRRLAKGNPAKFEEYVATSLNSLAILHRRMNRLADAEREHSEALEIYRRLAKDAPAKFEKSVAGVLNNLANLYKGMNRLTDAEREYAEAIEIYRRLAKDASAKFEESVAGVLKNLAVLHKSMNRLADAESEYAEAVGIYEKLASDCPEKFNEKLAKTLQGQAKLFLKMEKRDAAKANLERVVKILDPLVANGKKSLERDLNQAVELLATL